MAPLDQLQLSPSSSSFTDSPNKQKALSPLHHADLASLALPPSPLIQKPTLISKRSSNFNPPESSIAPLRILGGLVGSFGMPFLVYQSFPASTIAGNLTFVHSFWDGIFHFSSIVTAIICLVVSVYCGPFLTSTTTQRAPSLQDDGNDNTAWSQPLSRFTGMKPSTSRAVVRRFKAFSSTVDGLAFVIGLSIFLPLNLVGMAPLVYPNWFWYPFAWTDYHVSHTTHLAPALEGLCLEQPIHDIKLPRRSWSFPSLFSQTVTEAERQHRPLCLTEKSWEFLSAGALSSYSAKDVKSVLKGVDYARNQSGGVAIAVLARDIKDSIEPLRQNVESLKHFIPNLTVVIFENDSKDGSRDAIKQWAQVAEGYEVDLMECAEAVDCKMGKKHRDDGKDFAHTSAIGQMDVFRQRVTDYITETPDYEDYSHMLVIDVDVAVSFSPLGIMHTLGEHPENAVASSGRQLLPFAMGTLMPPYDLSAFRPWATQDNHNTLSWHETFCALKPAGDRWRNECGAASPLLMMEALRADSTWESGDFYRVESAFNGAVLYPLDDVRDSQATYDAGEDGQRCEHVGFNLALKRPMYVNHKWDFHIDPENPGGPTLWRAQNIIKHITTNPTLIGTIIFTQVICVYIFCHAFVTLGVFLIFPLLAPLFSRSKSDVRRIIAWHQKRTRIEDAEDTLLKLV